MSFQEEKMSRKRLWICIWGGFLSAAFCLVGSRIIYGVFIEWLATNIFKAPMKTALGIKSP
jgi:hypothetical protein